MNIILIDEKSGHETIQTKGDNSIKLYVIVQNKEQGGVNFYNYKDI